MPKETEEIEFKEKVQMMELLQQQLEKQYGKGSLVRLGENTREFVDTISSGSLALDEAIGIGGYACGRIIEIYGLEASGKTTLALHAIAEAQKRGGVAAFIDAEHALDPNYSRKIGVRVGDLWLSQPDSGEQALEIAESLVDSNAVDIIVIDSVAALVPQAELDGSMGDSHMGLQARLMSQAMRKLTSKIAKKKTVLIFINQIRQKIGLVFGNPETTTGGNALKFYSSLRLEVRKVEAFTRAALKQTALEDFSGYRVRVKVVKNKLASPFRKVLLEIVFGKGISLGADLLEVGLKYGFFTKSGSWYFFQGERIGQGRENVITYLEERPQLMESLNKAMRDQIFSTQGVTSGTLETKEVKEALQEVKENKATKAKK